MNELVEIKWNDAFTNSIALAEGTGLQHKSVSRLIQKQKKRLEKFGPLRFSDFKSTNPTGGRPVRVCFLNEQQATLLVTFMDNTEAVADFKVRLVKGFYIAKKLLMERSTKEWIETRRASKINRLSETDAIKKFVEYAKEQGSKHADMYYITITRAVNRRFGVKNRDEATTLQLNGLIYAENIIINTIEYGIRVGTEYHEIYRQCVEAVDRFIAIGYIDRLLLDELSEEDE